MIQILRLHLIIIPTLRLHPHDLDFEASSYRNSDLETPSSHDPDFETPSYRIPDLETSSSHDPDFETPSYHNSEPRTSSSHDPDFETYLIVILTRDSILS